MTAILGMTPGNYPVQMGDLLISSPHPSKKVVSIPTLGDVPPSPEWWPSIVEMRQKVCVIGQNLALSWAGSYLAARQIVDGMKEMADNGQVSLQAVLDHLENLDEWTSNQNVSILGHVAGPEGGTFSKACSVGHSPILGDVRIGGSGTDDLIELVKQFKSPISEEMRAANPLECAVACGLMLTGVLTTEELISKRSLERYYGGGFEVCSLVRGRFSKVGDITYLWWILEARGGGQFGLTKPRCIHKYDYVEDFLVVRSIDFGSNEESVGDRTYVVSPIDKRATAEDSGKFTDKMGLQSKFMVNMVSYRNSKGDDHILNRVLYSASREQDVRIIEEPKRIVVAFNDTFIHEILGDVEEHEASLD